MQQYKFDHINKETLTKLYSEFGLRAKEIGNIVGTSEGAVLKRLEQYDIPTNPRNKNRELVEIIFSGMIKKNITDEEIINYCSMGYTDVEIGKLCNKTGEAIAYRRKKLNIKVSDKPNEKKDTIKKFKETPIKILENDYYKLTQENFSIKYGISKIVWRPFLKENGVIKKNLHRINSYPPFTREQRILLMGSLLGDGSVSEGNFFYESHSLKQKQYLYKKANILRPYSSNISSVDNNTGLRMSTIHHPNFIEFYNLFYDEKIKGKLIPKIIQDEWHDHILAYWFFDDGYYNDEDNNFSFANKCPIVTQTREFVNFLNNKYGWGFSLKERDIYSISLPKKFFKEFVDILLQVATPDMYYKIPEKFLTSKMVSMVTLNTISDIKPKFYRKIELDEEKKRIERIIFNDFKNRPFPYSNLTEERKLFQLNTFRKHPGYFFKDNKLCCTTSGMDLCEGFFPNIYESHHKGYLSPLELWKDDNFLHKLVMNRLKYANRLTDSSIRTGIKLLSKSVTNFKPNIAKYIYSKYAPNGRVYDYSCGFGSRMLAAMSLGMEYVGCEPNLKTFSNLNKFGEFLKSNIGGSYSITESGSEDFVYKENYFDIAFSSPPFFDYEIYSDDPGQSIVKYPVYEEWLINFWKKTIDNCKRSIISGGYFGNCISINNHEKLIESTKCFCEELGLVLCDEIMAPYKQLLNGNKDKYDIILIFKKL